MSNNINKSVFFFLFWETLGQFGTSFSATKKNVQLHPFSSLDFLHGRFSVLKFPTSNVHLRTLCCRFWNFDIRYGLRLSFNHEQEVQAVVVSFSTPFKPAVNNAILSEASCRNSGDSRFVNFARYFPVQSFSMSRLKKEVGSCPVFRYKNITARLWVVSRFVAYRTLVLPFCPRRLFFRSRTLT